MSFGQLVDGSLGCLILSKLLISARVDFNLFGPLTF
jgi:hypothetical protein